MRINSVPYVGAGWGDIDPEAIVSIGGARGLICTVWDWCTILRFLVELLRVVPGVEACSIKFCRFFG